MSARHLIELRKWLSASYPRDEVGGGGRGEGEGSRKNVDGTKRREKIQIKMERREASGARKRDEIMTENAERMEDVDDRRTLDRV